MNGDKQTKERVKHERVKRVSAFTNEVSK